MVTVTPPPVKPHRASAPELAELRAACKRHGITQDRIAAVAGVSRPLVVNVFSGRNASRNVVETARRLVAAAEKALARARARKRENGGGA